MAAAMAANRRNNEENNMAASTWRSNVWRCVASYQQRQYQRKHQHIIMAGSNSMALSKQQQWRQRSWHEKHGAGSEAAAKHGVSNINGVAGINSNGVMTIA